MSTTTPAEVLALLERVKVNPANMQRVVLDKMTEASGGRMVFTDPGNPLILGIEMAVTMATACMAENAANTRKQYPTMAQTEEEVYMHMSDKDYYGRWSTPSRTVITVAMMVDEILMRAVPTGIGNAQKLVIPRHTQFKVADYAFTMQYPIEIRVMAHGGLQIVYDASKPSALDPLPTNQVKHTYRTTGDGFKWLFIEIPVQQIQINSSSQAVSLAQPFKQSFAYEDNFYALRAYHRESDFEPWKELRVTETDQVYDPTVPTMAIRVYSTDVYAEIPQVYINNGTISSQIRVDLYTTDGPIDLLLSSYDSSQFVATWRDLEDDDKGMYSFPLSNSMTTISVFSDSVTSGGSLPMSFAQLRESVILGATGNPDIPITSAQFTNALNARGFNTVKNIDNITDRIFAATRAMPLPVDDSVSSPMGSAIVMLQASMDTLAEYESVWDNGDRITVTPDMLYRLDNGVVKFVPEIEIANMRELPLETQARMITDGNYIFSPYHYVYDITDESFDCRGYWLDQCAIDSKSFVQENDTLGLEMSTQSYDLRRTPTGYVLELVAFMGDTVTALDPEQVHVQLAYKPVGEGSYACLNGTLLEADTDSGEYTYVFEIESNFDINKFNQLYLTNFDMYGGGRRPLATHLNTEFQLIYAVTDYFPPHAEVSEIDRILGTWILPPDTVGVIHETFYMTLGQDLDGMWEANRSVLGSEDYKRYAADVPWTYEAAEYELDADGNLVTVTDPVTGEMSYVLLHNKGEIRYIDGKVAIRFYKDEVMHDGEGRPIPLSTRRMVRQVDMFFLEGLYYFATSASAVNYRSVISTTVVGWLKDDITALRKVLLEKSILYFAPTTSLGDVRVMVEDGLIRTLPSAQNLKVEFYLTRNAYQDADLRLKLGSNARQVGAAQLLNQVVALDDIIDNLKVQVGEDVIALDVAGLGGDQNYAVVTMEDESMRLSIRHRLRALADGTLTVEDDLDVNFFRHAIPT